MIADLIDKTVVVFLGQDQSMEGPLVAVFKGAEEGMLFLEGVDDQNTHVVSASKVTYMGLEPEVAAKHATK